jgi:hypothetical protein
MEGESKFNSEKTFGRYGLWAMLSDVLRAAIARGQFTRALITLAAIVLIIKVSSQQLGDIIMNIIEGLRDKSILGYALSILLAIGWWIHVGILEDEHIEEISQMNRKIENIKSNKL